MSKLQSSTRSCLIALLLLLGVAGIGGSVARAEETLFDPRAEEILRRMSDFLGQAKTLKFKTFSLYDVTEPTGIKIKRAVFQDVIMRRPDRLRFHSSLDDGTERDAWYDGARLTIVPKDQKKFAQVEVPETLDLMLDFIQDNYPVNLPMVDLLYSDIYKTAKENLLSAVYLGERKIEGDVLDHLSFESTGADWQLWVEHGDRPVPRRLVITFVNAPGEPEYMAILRDWSFGEDIDDATFQFTPPSDWERFEIAKNPPPE
jgi:hypothetical protein